MRTVPLLTLLAVLAGGGPLPGSQGDPIPPPNQRPLALSWAVLPCETRGPFAGMVELRAALPLDEAAGGRLEVSPYPDGFKVGRFARVALDQGEKAFEVEPEPGASPPLDHLELVRVAPTDQQGLSIVVAGLEAGVGYDFRLAVKGSPQPITGPTTRVDAPTCYGDDEAPGK